MYIFILIWRSPKHNSSPTSYGSRIPSTIEYDSTNNDDKVTVFGPGYSPELANYGVDSPASHKIVADEKIPDPEPTAPIKRTHEVTTEFETHDDLHSKNNNPSKSITTSPLSKSLEGTKRGMKIIFKKF